MTHRSDTELLEREAAHCPRCLFEISPADCFCQECGSGLQDIGHESRRELSGRSVLDATFAPDEARAFWGSAKEITGVSSHPTPAYALANESAAKFLAHLHPRADRSAVTLPLIVSLIVLLALVPLACFFIEHYYSSISTQYAFDRALESMKSKKYDEAILLFEQAAIKKRLDKVHEQMLYDCYWARAERYASGRVYGAAVNDLQKIPRGYKNYDRVAAEMNQLSSLARGGQEAKSALASGARFDAKRSRAGQLLCRERQPPARKEPQGLAREKREASAPAASSGLSWKPGERQKMAVGSSPLALSKSSTEEESQLSRAGRDRGTTGGEVQKLAGAGPSVEADMAAYNERLANYFSQLKSDQQATTRRHAEPPSFKEWVTEGKPEF